MIREEGREGRNEALLELVHDGKKREEKRVN